MKMDECQPKLARRTRGDLKASESDGAIIVPKHRDGRAGSIRA